MKLYKQLTSCKLHHYKLYNNAISYYFNSSIPCKYSIIINWHRYFTTNANYKPKHAQTYNISNNNQDNYNASSMNASSDIHDILCNRDLKSDVNYCINLVKQHDNDMYLSLLFIPKQYQTSLFILHAFNIELNRIIHTIKDNKLQLIRYKWWESTIQLIKQAQQTPPLQPIAIGLSLLNSRYNNNLSWNLLEQLIQSRANELMQYLQQIDENGESVGINNIQPTTIYDIHNYSENTYTALFKLSSEIFINSNNNNSINEFNAAASHLGRSLGIIQVLKSIPYNAKQNKIYIPIAIQQDCKLDINKLLNNNDNTTFPELTECVYKLGIVAKTHIDYAREYTNKINPPHLKTILLPTIIADRWLNKLESTNFNIYSPIVQSMHNYLAEPLIIRYLLWKNSKNYTY